MILLGLPAPVQQLWDATAAFAPAAASALAVLGGMWLAAVIARRVVGRLLRMTALDRAVTKTRVGRVLEAFKEGFTASDAVATAAYIAILLLAVMASADALGLDAVQKSLGGALVYVPRLFSALVVVAVGSFVGSAARRAVGAVLLEIRSPLAGPAETATEFGILLIAGLFALGILGIDVSFVTGSLSLLIGMGAATVCFLLAWSMRGPSVELIANYYLRRLVRVGDDVEFGDVRGTVERFAPLGVMLRDASGTQRFVPARNVLAGLSRSPGATPPSP